MIHNLCNLVDDVNFDLFYKATIIEASQLPNFDHLSLNDDILGIVNSLPESFQAMVVPFIHEKFSLSDGTRINNGNINFNPKLSLPIVPQDANVQQLLNTFNNRQVVVLVTRRSHSYLYGTSAQPLLFTYSELHANNPTGLKGYTLNMQGDSYGPALYFAGRESEFPVIRRGLAFELAGSL